MAVQPPAKKPSESMTEMVQVVLPNDANPLGYLLGGTAMHLIDIAGAIAGHRHTRTLLVTAAVDGLQFLHPIKIGDLVILKARVTATWTTSLEVEVEVFSEETLTGRRRMTSLAYLTFVAVDRDSHRVPIPRLILETDDDRRRAAEAQVRRVERLRARSALERAWVQSPINDGDARGRDRAGARILFGLAIAAAAGSAVLAFSDGFSLRLFGLRVSSHGGLRPALFALLFAVIAYRLHPENRAFRRLAAFGAPVVCCFHGWRRRPPPSSSLSASISACGRPADPTAMGMSSQARLWLAGDLHVHQDFAAAVPWPNADWTFTPLGYRPAQAIRSFRPTRRDCRC